MFAFRSISRVSVPRLAACRRYATEIPNLLKLTFASPYQTFYMDTQVALVTVPAGDGDMGVLADHVPTLAVLRSGLLSVTETEGGTVKKYFVSSGTMTVNENSIVQIAAEEAAPLSDFDPKKVEDCLTEYTAKVETAVTDVEKAEADIGLEVYRALSVALSDQSK